MRIIFEQYKYKATDVNNVLRDICTLQNADKMICVNYVGYYYSPQLKDVVFILPKVLLCDKEIIYEDGRSEKKEVLADVHPIKCSDPNDPWIYPDVLDNSVSNWILPESIIHPDGQNKYLPQEYRKFIYEFSVWIYRSICVYRSQNPSSDAIYYQYMYHEGRGSKHEANTFLDVLLSLVRFNRENQDFFLYTIKNIHSGVNKINWGKTITQNKAIFQHCSPIYINPLNKKRLINYDEELFIIFFSIINHINEKYGFRTPINCQYPLITGKNFDSYIKGRGKSRLMQIRYKYFSDKCVLLWDLCFAFFESSYKLAIGTTQQEYLLAKNYEHIFEAMIDELIGDPRKDIPKGLKDQDDGKQVDHMFTYHSLTSTDEQSCDEIYYIGDSKYYKVGHSLGKESIYKQFTYAKNVIQWNLNLFLNVDKEGWTDEDVKAYESDKNNSKFKKIRLRNDLTDDLTEGYNIIPNFFISAFVNKDRKYTSSDIKKHVWTSPDGQELNTHFSCQFENRLFDRDTLMLAHYDVNFLFIIYLYSRNKANEKAAWKKQIREKFRDEIRQVIETKYNFYALEAHPNIDSKKYIKDHFQELLGKIFTPYYTDKIISLALETEDKDGKNEYLLNELKKYFYVIKVNLGQDPQEKLIPLKEADAELLLLEEHETIVLINRKLSDNQLKGFDPIDYIALNLSGVKKVKLTPSFLQAKYIILHYWSNPIVFEIKSSPSPMILSEVEKIKNIVLATNNESMYLVYNVERKDNLSQLIDRARFLSLQPRDQKERYNPIVTTWDSIKK